MMNRNRNMERAIRRRERERLADLNRDDPKILRGFIRITAAALAILACVMVLIWASAVRADQEAFAATLRRTRLIREEMAEDRTYYHVPPLPEFPPVDGEPPQAIEIKMATKAEAIPEERWESLGVFKTTGFCNCKKCSGKWAGGKTKSGVYPEEGITIAVDPKVIPMGSKVMIDGIGVRVAQDTGKHIKGKCIDVYYDDHGTAWNHGEQYHEVFVLRK